MKNNTIIEELLKKNLSNSLCLESFYKYLSDWVNDIGELDIVNKEVTNLFIEVSTIRRNLPNVSETQLNQARQSAVNNLVQLATIAERKELIPLIRSLSWINL